MTETVVHTEQTAAEIIAAALQAHEIVDWLTDCCCGWAPEKNLGTTGTWTALTAHRADSVAEALAGRLLPDGGETRTEWAVEMTDAEGGQVALAHRTEFDYRTTPTWSESIAQGMVREARRHSPPARVVRRTVHVGPWEPAP